MSNPKRAQLPNSLKDIFSCKACKLSDTSHPVYPRGNWDSKVAFIGEAAGKVEEEKDISASGPAGIELEESCRRLGINIDTDILFYNVILCRPRAENESGKQNRAPNKEELGSCRNNLEKITLEFNPKLIVAVGKPAAEQLLNFPITSIQEVVGKFFSREELSLNIDTDVYVIHHPAFILRNPEAKKPWMHQLMRLRDYMIMRNLFIR